MPNNQGPDRGKILAFAPKIERAKEQPRGPASRPTPQETATDIDQNAKILKDVLRLHLDKEGIPADVDIELKHDTGEFAAAWTVDSKTGKSFAVHVRRYYVTPVKDFKLKNTNWHEIQHPEGELFYVGEVTSKRIVKRGRW